jgi:hypothetical protein
VLQVCELDIIFNFHKVRTRVRDFSSPHCESRNQPACGLRCVLFQAYYILDEVLIGGHLQEVNKREILRICATQDDMMEEPKEGTAAMTAGPTRM